jgi:glycosyltransferase involved in cell wall biosynthesis
MRSTSTAEKAVKIINCCEDAPESWTFLKQEIAKADSTWFFFTAKREKWFERIIRRPNLSRYRTCLRAAWKSRDCDFVISHLPKVTCWFALFAKICRSRARHLAFSFNFTTLPTGLRRAIMRTAFSSVDRFVVYSTAEKELYSQYFNIDSRRIDVLPWTVKVPHYEPSASVMNEPYLCAVGGEGRDYARLLDAVRPLTHLRVVLVVRPHNLAGLQIPSHVQVYTNLQNARFWNIVKFSRFVVIPLVSDSTNCGHVTIVGSLLHGIPIVTTYSAGTAEYVFHEKNALVSRARDVEALRTNIERLWRDDELRMRLSAESKKSAIRYDEQVWVDYLKNYLCH